MRLPQSSVLCDAMEIGALQLQVGLSTENVLAEAFANSKDERDRFVVSDAFAVAMDRASACPNGYPFIATPRMLTPRKIGADFDNYLFLLLGVSLSQRGMADIPNLAREFRSGFEDYVRWVLLQTGMLAEVLSEPREKRGLPKSLEPALAQVAQRFGQEATLNNTKLVPHDNDLDVDVIATPSASDGVIGGWPVVLLQCATGPVGTLHTKILEIGNTFCSVWNKGFEPKTTIHAGATPDDLLKLDPVYWGRLIEGGIVLHRTRLVNFAVGGASKTVPSNVVQLESKLRNALASFDWRNGWQQD